MGEMSSGMLMSEQRGSFKSYTVNEDDTRIKTLEEQISKQEVSCESFPSVSSFLSLSFSLFVTNPFLKKINKIIFGHLSYLAESTAYYKRKRKLGGNWMEGFE